MSDFWKSIALLLLSFLRQLLDMAATEDHTPLVRQALLEAETKMSEKGVSV